MFIDSISAIEVMDSRGNPTVKATVELSDGTLSPFNQATIDATMKELDGTDNYGNLGANAVLGVSMAVARAAAKSLGMPLYRYLGGANAMTIPTPMLNIINGGSHADNSVDFQEYMIVPVGFEDFTEGLRASSEVYHTLKGILKAAKHNTALGDEGGFAPDLSSNEEPIQIIMQAIEKAGYKAGEQIAIALDVAASEILAEGGGYNLASENRVVTSAELVDYYVDLCAKYPIVSIEDGLNEDDWDGFKLMTEKALNCGQIKTGSTARGERTAKYNRLMEIENEVVYGEYLGSAIFN